LSSPFLLVLFFVGIVFYSRYSHHMVTSDKQTSLWQQRPNQQVLSELCNALYERELKRLSQDETMSLDMMKKRLASLPYYIKRAAEHINELFIPLELDSQNGSWFASQSSKPFSLKADTNKTDDFYTRHGQMALIVPVSIFHYGIEQVVLDTIDEVDSVKRRVHCNQHGWFHYSGESVDETSIYKKVLLKPGKPVMSAACCGHQWLNQKKSTPRLLSLREMLLASRINWRQFHKLLPLHTNK